jgi:hypothetical protein
MPSHLDVPLFFKYFRPIFDLLKTNYQSSLNQIGTDIIQQHRALSMTAQTKQSLGLHMIQVGGMMMRAEQTSGKTQAKALTRFLSAILEKDIQTITDLGGQTKYTEVNPSFVIHLPFNGLLGVEQVFKNARRVLMRHDLSDSQQAATEVYNSLKRGQHVVMTGFSGGNGAIRDAVNILEGLAQKDATLDLSKVHVVSIAPANVPNWSRPFQSVQNVVIRSQGDSFKRLNGYQSDDNLTVVNLVQKPSHDLTAYMQSGRKQITEALRQQIMQPIIQSIKTT